MKFLKKLFAPREVSAALGVLDEISCKINSSAFELIYSPVENMLLSDMNKTVSVLKKFPSIRVWILNTVANLAGDAVESGEFHVYRGVLDPWRGEPLLKTFDFCLEELTKEGQISFAKAEEQKDVCRDNIRNVG